MWKEGWFSRPTGHDYALLERNSAGLTAAELSSTKYKKFREIEYDERIFVSVYSIRVNFVKSEVRNVKFKIVQLIQCVIVIDYPENTSITGFK